MVYAFGSLARFPNAAEPAAGHAHVGGIDVPVDVEIGCRAMQTLAHQIRHVPQRENVRSLIERDAVVIGQASPPSTLSRIGRKRGSSMNGCMASAPQQQHVSGPKHKNSTLTQPFMVKNAALTRERSSGFTRAVFIHEQQAHRHDPRHAERSQIEYITSASRHRIMRMCSNAKP